MTDKAIVSYIGVGEYRIDFPRPFKFDMNLSLLAGTYKIRVLSDERQNLAIGVEGGKETLLNWLRSMEVIDETRIKSYEEAMTQ